MVIKIKKSNTIKFIIKFKAPDSYKELFKELKI
jgi:HKD family nuclease